jgi:catechol 2,3-dioxygenase-like lactoylglutathione lyase family enzyme
MAIEGVFYVFVLVSDLQRAKRFYGDTLGWQLGTDEDRVAGFAFGSGYLVAHVDSREKSAQSHVRDMHVAVRVNGLESEHTRLAGRGVEVTPIQTHPWGERNFSFTDPDGYLWVYSESPAG